MGTRSTVAFIDNGQCIAKIYQQYDGYISGVGHELAEWLKGKTIVNGFNSTHEDGRHANGMGCLAAQYIADHKQGIGGFYMTSVDDAQEYNYIVTHDGRQFNVKVDDIFDGTPDELLKFSEE